MIRPRLIAAACGLALGLAACTAPPSAAPPGGAPPRPAARGDGLDVEQLPEGVRADYAVFAQRCSKCHALSRALNSGIDDDEFWKHYVDRMRRQPASGISPDDEIAILRFLHHYSIEVRRAKAARQEG